MPAYDETEPKQTAVLQHQQNHSSELRTSFRSVLLGLNWWHEIAVRKKLDIILYDWKNVFMDSVHANRVEHLMYKRAQCFISSCNSDFFFAVTHIK